MDTLALSVLERRGNRMVAPPPHHTVCPTLLSGLRPPWDRDTTLLDDVIGLPVELGESVPASGRGLHRVAIPAEELGQCAHDARFIVNQQNHDRGCAGPSWGFLHIPP
jgi:hypothetical protein